MLGGADGQTRTFAVEVDASPTDASVSVFGSAPRIGRPTTTTTADTTRTATYHVRGLVHVVRSRKLGRCNGYRAVALIKRSTVYVAEADLFYSFRARAPMKPFIDSRVAEGGACTMFDTANNAYLLHARRVVPNVVRRRGGIFQDQGTPLDVKVIARAAR